MTTSEEYKKDTVERLMGIGWPRDAAEMTVDVAMNASHKAFDTLDLVVAALPDEFLRYQAMKMALNLVAFKASSTLEEAMELDKKIDDAVKECGCPNCVAYRGEGGVATVTVQ